MRREQVSLGDIGIFQIPAVLEGQILFRPLGNGYFRAHAEERAFRRMRSSSEAS